MTLLGAAVSRAWGECMWTARDLLKQPVRPLAQSGVTINMQPRPCEPEVRFVPVLIERVRA